MALTQIRKNKIECRGGRSYFLKLARLLIDWLVAHERYFPDDQVEQEQSVVLPDDKFVTSDPGDIIIKRKGDGCTQDEAV